MRRPKWDLTPGAVNLGVVIPEARSYPTEPRDVRSANDRVRALADELEAEKFQALGDRPTWARLDELQRLARAQVADDVLTEGHGSRRARVGDEWVNLSDRGDVTGADADPIWDGPQYGPEQVALETGFRVYLPQLTAKQRDVLRLLFWPQTADGEGRWRPLTERQAAATLGIRQSGVQKHRDLALKALGRLLRAAFPAPDAGTRRPPESRSPVFSGPDWVFEARRAVWERAGRPHGPVGHLTFGGPR